MKYAIQQLAAASSPLTPRLKNADLLNTEQAADYVGVTPHTLEVWRCVKRHAIPYIKVGRLVKYRSGDLDAWLVSRTIDGEVQQ